MVKFEHKMADQILHLLVCQILLLGALIFGVFIRKPTNLLQITIFGIGNPCTATEALLDLITAQQT